MKVTIMHSTHCKQKLEAYNSGAEFSKLVAEFWIKKLLIQSNLCSKIAIKIPILERDLRYSNYSDYEHQEQSLMYITKSKQKLSGTVRFVKEPVYSLLPQKESKIQCSNMQ